MTVFSFFRLACLVGGAVLLVSCGGMGMDLDGDGIPDGDPRAERRCVRTSCGSRSRRRRLLARDSSAFPSVAIIEQPLATTCGRAEGLLRLHVLYPFARRAVRPVPIRPHRRAARRARRRRGSTSLSLLSLLFLLVAISSDESLDEQLCKWYQEDPDRYGEVILHRHGRRIRRMAYEVVADSILPPDHVGDVVTEMGVALLRAARTYTDDHGAVFLTYLHQVALRAGQDYVRRETHILLTLGRSLDDFPSDEERDAYLCHSACQHKDCRTCRQSHDPLEAFIVSGLYDSLSESQRVALQVIAAGGSERDIARAVGCSLEAARKLRQRLLKLLRDR